MKLILPILGSLLLLSLASLSFAADAPAAGPKDAQGLTATLIANKDTCTLDPATSGKEFRARTALLKGQAPAPSTVDLTLRLTNTTDKDITINIGGDSSHFDLTLEGAGALTVTNQVMMDRMFRIGQPTTIAAGKSVDLPISSLAFGARNNSKYAYFTEAGDYTLTAALVYSANDKQITLTSAPLKLKVEAAK